MSLKKPENSSLTDIQVAATSRLLEALQESESRMRRRINLLVEILFELNDDGEIVFSNAAWEKVLGYKLVNGTKLSNYIYPSDLDVFRNTLSNMVIDKESRSNVLIRCQHADGHLLLMNANLVLMESGILGIFHDVTKNIQIQNEALKKCNRKYSGCIWLI